MSHPQTALAWKPIDPDDPFGSVFIWPVVVVITAVTVVAVWRLFGRKLDLKTAVLLAVGLLAGQLLVLLAFVVGFQAGYAEASTASSGAYQETANDGGPPGRSNLHDK